MALPGDRLVTEPAQQSTRAITIDAEPEDVWPWVVQIGADRGGFYSYEWLENLFGLGIRNSEVVVPEWQHRAVGDLVLADAKGSGGWYSVRCGCQGTKPCGCVGGALRAVVGADVAVRRQTGDVVTRPGGEHEADR